MPVTRASWLGGTGEVGRAGAALLATCALLLGVAIGCGGDDHGGTVGTGKNKDGGSAQDAAADAALDATTKPPDHPNTQAGSGAPKVDQMPPSSSDASVVTCASLDCESMSDGCNVASCDEQALRCVLTPLPDGTACGSDVLDNCTAPDQCHAGVCEPRDTPEGTPCGDQGKSCRIDDSCDGSGHCVDHGLAAAGTPCGDQTPSDPACDAPDSCDANGVCQPNYAAADTPCGDTDVACRFDDKCDGFGTCQDGGFWTTGACPNGQTAGGDCVCGRTDQTFCHPKEDVCVDGTCVLGSLPDEFASASECPGGLAPDGRCACGSTSSSECDNPDSCLLGMCVSNPEPPGTACGDGTTHNSGCDLPDVCDGGGQCDPNYADDRTACGTAPGPCADAPLCNGLGTCGVAVKKPSGTVCGSAPGDCYLAPTCNGTSNSCPAAAPAPSGASCGEQTPSDPDCDAPDSCDGSGTCNPNHVAVGASCGSSASSECSAPDTCDGAGACDPNDATSGTACGNGALRCAPADSCDGSGTCTDNGVTTPCVVSGIVDDGSGTPEAGVSVSVLPSGPSTTSDVNGAYSLAMPLLSDFFLQVGAIPGFYGWVQALNLSPQLVENSIDLSLYTDSYVTDPASGSSITVDPQKGVVVVLFDTLPAGAIGASLSATSEPVVDLGDVLVFYNVAPGTTTVSVSPSSCRLVTALTPYPVFARTVTLVDVTCD